MSDKQFKLGDIISGQPIVGIEESYYTDETGVGEYRSVHTEYFCRRIYVDAYSEYVINPMNNFKERPGEGEDDEENEMPLKTEELTDSYAEKIAEAREERHESEKVNVYVSTVALAYDKALERLLEELKELFSRVDKASMDAIRIQSDYSAIFDVTDDYQNDLLDNAICGLNQAAENLEQLIGWRENGGD